tara:strand:- start:374 stop:727 length:354 start_codon:yes stop_codon:yes gene_type:complete
MSQRDSKGRFKQGNKVAKGHGRPKGVESIAQCLKEIGREDVPPELKERVDQLFSNADTTEITMMEAILRTTMMYAIQGKQWAVQFIADRTEGRPHQTIGISESDEPVRVFDFNEVDD